MSWEVKARDGQMGQDGQRDTKPKKEKSTFCFIPRPPRAGRGKRRPKSEHWVRVHYASSQRKVTWLLLGGAGKAGAREWDGTGGVLGWGESGEEGGKRWHCMMHGTKGMPLVGKKYKINTRLDNSRSERKPWNWKKNWTWQSPDGGGDVSL